MANLKKIIAYVVPTVLIAAVLMSVLHYMVFPYETRSMLVSFSNRPCKYGLYYNKNDPDQLIDSILHKIEIATRRVNDFWGGVTCTPKFIYCNSPEGFKIYGGNMNVPAVTYLKLGEVIVLSQDGIDVDIIAHEISHAEFFKRIGFYAFTYKIPSWFKHGLAMQNDYRNYYSEDTLRAQTNSLPTMLDMQELLTDQQFYSGDRAKIMQHYMSASYVVKKWHTPAKLRRLVQALGHGEDFNDALGDRE